MCWKDKYYIQEGESDTKISGRPLSINILISTGQTVKTLPDNGFTMF